MRKVSAMTQAGTVPQKLLDSREVAALAWRPLAGRAGLYDRVLWQDPAGKSHAGLLHMDPGTSVPPHLHPRATHHLWVVSGSCTIDGRTLDGGSYVFVPACRMHGIPQVGRAGCVLFYLYLHQAAAQRVAQASRGGPAHLTDEQQAWAAAAAVLQVPAGGAVWPWGDPRLREDDRGARLRRAAAALGPRWR
jgi:mannose-6-phosphate isomerase-like protein (cupin superfamily)